MINELLISLSDIIWGWPLIIFIVVCSLILTIGLHGIQFVNFKRMWTETLFGDHKKSGEGDMTSFQAFLNALSTSLGNGSIAGMATAIQAGGPGAAFWVFVMGLFNLAFRFSEVFLACYYPGKKEGESFVSGPMVYLRHVPGGSYLPYVYTMFLFFLAVVTGNMMQANSIRIGFVRILGIEPVIIALILFAFITYVMVGGAERIIQVSDKIVPVKVIVFFGSAIIVLLYHIQAIIPALKLIITSAFSAEAIAGGALGYSVQSAIRFGLSRSINASEAGLGVAAILFGATGERDGKRNGIIAMLSAFVSANLVCFMVALMLIASGVWNNGQTSIDLTISSYETVFGALGGWIVTFLSVSFGLGCLVSYAYVARACWLFLTGGRFVNTYSAIYCIATFIGAMAQVQIIWNSTDLVNAGLLITNIFGMVWLLPVMRKELFSKNA